jgi:hypothetical protein
VCRSFSYEEFIATQDKFQKKQAETLCVLNEEVARAIEDVISLVQVSHWMDFIRILVQPCWTSPYTDFVSPPGFTKNKILQRHTQAG